jgi:hypothetical protein
MATSSLDPDLIESSDRQLGRGHDNKALGPSDSSDSGSDFTGLSASGDDSDSNGTGEGVSINPDSDRQNSDIDIKSDDDDIDGDLDEEFAENDEIDPDFPVDTDENDLSPEQEIRDLNLDIDEIEDD